MIIHRYCRGLALSRPAISQEHLANIVRVIGDKVFHGDQLEFCPQGGDLSGEISE